MHILTWFSNIVCISSSTSSRLRSPLIVTFVERRKIVFLVLFLNVHELMSAGPQESSGRHLLRTLVSEKLSWILEQSNSAVVWCRVRGHWKASSKLGRQHPTQGSCNKINEYDSLHYNDWGRTIASIRITIVWTGDRHPTNCKINSYMLTSVSTTPSSSTSREHSLDALVKLNLRRHYGSIDNTKNNMRIL